MKSMFLLGAGSSVKANIPDSYKMTNKLLSLFSEDSRNLKYYKVLSFVVGGLLFQKGKNGVNPFDGVNVEEVFNAVQLLANRRSLELAPFVGSWNEMIDLLDLISPYNPKFEEFNEEIYKSITRAITAAFPSSSAALSERELDDAFRRSHSLGRAVHKYLDRNMKEWFRNMKTKRPVSSFAFEKKLTKAIRSTEKISGKGKIFEDTSERMIINLIKLVWIKDYSDVSYLKPILSVYKNQKCLTVATLNYDNAIELLAKNNSIECNTGIKEWSKTGEFSNANNSIYLLKIHGSIDWKLVKNESSSACPMPQNKIEMGDPDDVNKNYYRPAVIFGQRNKLTAAGPFLDLMHAFYKELLKNEQVIVIGYSFRDDHVNEYLTKWLNSSCANRMIVIDPGFEKNPNEYTLNLQGRLKGRIEIFNKKVEDVLESVCKTIVEV